MIPLKDLIRNLLPRNVRKHRILTDTLQGKYIVTSWYDYPAAIMGYTEHRLLDWFSQNVQLGETWLDVGAHYGYTAIALSRLVGTTGRVFAFEPMISTAGYLAQTRLLNGLTQLTVLPLALACPQSINMNQLPVTRGMVDSTVGRMHLGGEQKEKWFPERLNSYRSCECRIDPSAQAYGCFFEARFSEIIADAQDESHEHRLFVVVRP